MGMEKRTLGKTGLEVGILGLGTEHIIPEPGNVDAIFDLAVAVGLNYVDLLFNDLFADIFEGVRDYWDALRPAILRHRDNLVLCLHWGTLYEQPLDLCQDAFDKTLKNLGNDYAEIAMVSMVDTQAQWENWATKAIERLEGYRRDGRIGYIGLSNHNPEVARMAVESGLIDVLMFPVNLYQHPSDLDRSALLDTCMKHQVGVIAMKPYYGGILLQKNGMPTGITPIQCLHYVLSQPVEVAVPGVGNVKHMQEALAYLSASEEEKSFSALQDNFEHWLQGQCVRCMHCLPCPQEIHIPSIIWILDYIEYFGLTPLHQQYNRSLYEELPVKASECIECEVCMDRCPFDVDIIGKMRRAVEVFG